MAKKWFDYSAWIQKLGLGRFNSIFKQAWESGLKSTTILYNCRGKGNTDIRKVYNVTAEGEVELDKVVHKQGWEDLSNDEAILEIAEYVNRRIKYRHDKFNYGAVEYWADPYTLWKKRSDDCDGYATLITKLGWMAGIPRFRLRLVAGYVDDGRNTEGGHAWVMYLREQDNQWYVIEGSYKSRDAFRRYSEHIDYSGARDYKNIWWWTTDEESYARHPLVLKRRVDDGQEEEKW